MGPVRLLTIGPGAGILEGALKKRFGDDLQIDTFSLTARVAPANLPAFETIYVGNLDTHRLPTGYDLIFSLFGATHADDQARVFRNLVSGLAGAAGSEAYYSYYDKNPFTGWSFGTSTIFHASYATLPPYTPAQRAIMQRDYGLTCGIRPDAGNIHVYLRRGRDIPDIDTLCTALQAADIPDDRRAYRMDTTSPYRFGTAAEISAALWDGAIAAASGDYWPPNSPARTRCEAGLARFITTGIGLVNAGFPIATVCANYLSSLQIERINP